MSIKIPGQKIAFQVYFNEKTGEIERIYCTKRFTEEGALFKLDIIKETIEALEQIYEYEKKKYFEEYDIARA